jgi:hypothetical protein
MECPFCAEMILARAKKCRHCGETVDVAMRKAEEALRAADRQNGNVYMNAAVSAPSMPAYVLPAKSKSVAIVLALLLGGLGLHKFYLGKPVQGILYLVFCWTFIPAVLGIIDAVVYACSSDVIFRDRQAVAA